MPENGLKVGILRLRIQEGYQTVTMVKCNTTLTEETSNVTPKRIKQLANTPLQLRKIHYGIALLFITLA